MTKRRRGARTPEPAAAAGPEPLRLAGPATVVFLVALALRVGHALYLGREPLAGLLLGDSARYDAWARDLAGGNWWGRGVFYQAPLYPYLLGVWYALAGPGLLALRVLQAILGAATCALVTLAAGRFFGRAAALAAGLVTAAYAPAIFFDALLQKTVLDTLLTAGLVLACAAVGARADAGRALLAGAVLGLLGLSRENALVLLPVLLAWIGWRARPRRLPVIFALAGVLAVLLPVAIRNRVVGGELHLTTAQLGPNLYIGNHEHANGTYVPLRRGRGNARYEQADATLLAETALGRELEPGEVSEYWRDRALEWIAAHPGRWLELTGRKLLLTWNAAEPMDSDDYATHASWSPLLRACATVLDFGVLAPLAAFGAWRVRARWRGHWVLHAGIVAYVASLCLFYVLGRYRHPLLPWLAPFAGAALAGLPAWWRTTPVRERLAAAAVVGGVALVAHLPLVAGAPQSALAAFNLGRALALEGRTEAAVAQYRRALELDSGLPEAHTNLGVLLAAQGRQAEALREFEAAVAVGPDDAAAHANLGSELAARGELERALASLERAVALDPLDPGALYNLGTALAASSRNEEAIGRLQESLRLDPNNARAHNNLGILFASTGHLREAVASFESALRLRPDFAEARANLERARELLESDVVPVGGIEPPT